MTKDEEIESLRAALRKETAAANTLTDRLLIAANALAAIKRHVLECKEFADELDAEKMLKILQEVIDSR